ncbi:MAG: OmpA family protein [Candidatus Obscuribacterales bacterium]|nr:OmpA family protein [Candidatus Obscuribacterales bacterium]
MSKRDHQSIFLSSINDLMTSLAVVFILLLVVYASNARAESMKLQQVIDELKGRAEGSFSVKEDLRQHLAKQNLQFANDDADALALVYSAPDDKLQFDTNKSDLHGEGARFLDGFVPKVMRVISAPAFASNVESILIEGHTDSDGDDERNLKLSQDRAFAVLRYSLNQCCLDQGQLDFLLNYTSINGRGERCLLPIGSQPGSENKARSRRVLFKIRVKSLEQKIHAAQETVGPPSR